MTAADDAPGEHNGAEPFCPTCQGERLAIPGKAYMHKHDCPELCKLTAVRIVVGDGAYVMQLGSLKTTAATSDKDVEIMLAMMMREAGRNWVRRLTIDETPEADSDHPAPDDALQFARELLDAESPDDQLVAGFRLSLALGDWLAEV